MANVARTVATVLCGVLGAGLLLAAGLGLRLSQGPIGLDFLTPRLEAALASADGSTHVDIGSTTLEWDARDRGLDVRVSDVRVLGPGGEPRAAIPAVAVGIAPAGLILGSVVPREIEAIAPRLHLVREADGRLGVGLGQEPAAATAQLLLGALARDAGRAPRGGLSALRTIRVRDGELVLDDRAGGVTWHATGLTLVARRDAGGIVLERLAFDVDPASVVVTGTLRGGAADLDLSLARLPTRALERWWPPAVAPVLRSWVLGHVTGGGITTVSATLGASLTDGAAPRVVFGSVAGRAVFGGLDVRWWKDMPLITGIGGTATFSSQGWQVRVARGEMEGLDVIRAVAEPATVRDAPGIRVDGVVRAPISKVLALLERPGLRAAANFPFRPGEISGGATANVQVVAPFAGGVAAVLAHGELRSVSLRRAFRGRNVNARHLHFDLGARAFEMRGEITVGRAPLQLRWRETIGGASRGERVIVVKGRLDDEGRNALGAKLGSWVEGPVDFQARLVPTAPGASAMDVRVDLTPASIDLPLINMVKDVGAPGAAVARLALTNGRVSAVDSFRLHAAGSSIEGRALLNPDESWHSAEGTIAIPPRSAGGGPATITVGLKPAGTRNQLTVTADDASAVLRAVDAYADASGGELKIEGELRLGVPGLPFTGTVEIERFVLTHSPIMAKIAAMGSVGGIIDALSGGGLPFSQLVASFTQRAGVITIADGIAAGPGLAIVVRGTVDRPRDDLSLDGTLVPNYDGLNTLVKDLPAPLTSFGGEAIPALDFSVIGSLTDPYVQANPAKAIAPTTLRDLLRLTTARGGLVRRGRRTAATDVEEAGVAPETTRARKAGARKRKTRGPGDAKAETKPAETTTKRRVKRRAPAAPAAPGTDTE